MFLSESFSQYLRFCRSHSVGGLSRIWNNSCSQNRLQEPRGRHRLSTVIQPLHQNAGEVVDLTVDEDGKSILYNMETLFIFPFFCSVLCIFLKPFSSYNFQIISFFPISNVVFAHNYLFSQLSVVPLLMSLNDERTHATYSVADLSWF